MIRTLILSTTIRKYGRGFRALLVSTVASRARARRMANCHCEGVSPKQSPWLAIERLLRCARNDTFRCGRRDTEFVPHRFIRKSLTPPLSQRERGQKESPLPQNGGEG